MISGMIFRILVAGLIEGFTFKGITYPATWYYYTVFSPIISTIVTIITLLITQKANPPKHIIV
jgi:predicted membrane protein